MTYRSEKKPRKRKCQCGCGQIATGGNGITAWASIECALVIANNRQAKQQRKEDKARKERLKTRRDWINEAQHAFNAYIRARDSGKPCICCGEPLSDETVGGGFDCGHYRSTGSAPHLRFDERNAHAQRKHCNRWRGGRAVDYRIGLIQRIGLSAVEALEADNEPRKWTVEQLREIRDTYRRKLRELKSSES